MTQTKLRADGYGDCIALKTVDTRHDPEISGGDLVRFVWLDDLPEMTWKVRRVEHTYHGDRDEWTTVVYLKPYRLLHRIALRASWLFDRLRSPYYWRIPWYLKHLKHHITEWGDLLQHRLFIGGGVDIKADPIMTEYTVVLKNGHCFRVECEHSLPAALWEAHASDTPVIEHESFALTVDEVAAIYPAEYRIEPDLGTVDSYTSPNTAT